MAYVLLFTDNDLEIFFGKWTLTPQYVMDRSGTGQFNCFTFYDQDRLPNNHCVKMDTFNQDAQDYIRIVKKLNYFSKHWLEVLQRHINTTHVTAGLENALRHFVH